MFRMFYGRGETTEEKILASLNQEPDDTNQPVRVAYLKRELLDALYDMMERVYPGEFIRPSKRESRL